jgi:hypothetical protein
MTVCSFEHVQWGWAVNASVALGQAAEDSPDPKEALAALVARLEDVARSEPRRPGEKETVSAQKLDQLQPFLAAALPQECMGDGPSGQLATYGPT